MEIGIVGLIVLVGFAVLVGLWADKAGYNGFIFFGLSILFSPVLVSILFGGYLFFTRKALV